MCVCVCVCVDICISIYSIGIKVCPFRSYKKK